MKKFKIKNKYHKIKKSKFLPVYIVLLVFFIGIITFVSYESIVEKEAINSNFLLNELESQFIGITDYSIGNTDPLILQRIDSDIKPILSKKFGSAKIEKHLLIKSVERKNYHMFYFTKLAPTAEEFKLEFIDEIESLGYVKKEFYNERTFEFYLDFQSEKYLVIFNLLSYNSEDSIGMYMIYVQKI